MKYPSDDNPVEGFEYGMGMSDIEYQLLYSFYSFPNIVLPLLGGYFIDRIGKRYGIVLFASVVTAGQFLFALSTHVVRGSHGFGRFLMIFSRMVFGYFPLCLTLYLCRLGGESLSVTESTFVASWFKGKELSMALGIDLCVSRLFAVINDAVQPAFYQASGYKLSLGFWFGFILCIFAVGAAVFLAIYDLSADKSCVQIEVPISAYQQQQQKQQVQDIDEKEEEDEAEDQMNFSDIRKFPLTYWLLAGSCVFIYTSFMSFMNVASDFLQTRFDYGLEAAGVVMVLDPLTAIGSALHHRGHPHSFPWILHRPHGLQDLLQYMFFIHHS